MTENSRSTVLHVQSRRGSGTGWAHAPDYQPSHPGGLQGTPKTGPDRVLLKPRAQAFTGHQGRQKEALSQAAGAPVKGEQKGW